MRGCLVLLVTFVLAAVSGAASVGKDEALNITASIGISRVDVISYPSATSIAVKFDSFNVPVGDLVIVRSPSGDVFYSYSGKGRDESSTFTSTPIVGAEAVVEYVAHGSTVDPSAPAATAFRITGFTRGSSRSHIESLCGVESSVPAKCYLANTPVGATLPLAYERAQAVLRTRKGEIPWCTGWLVGSEGHFITNHHCVKDWEANVFGAEFAAESASCSEQCDFTDGCRGVIGTKSSTWVAGDPDIDYALLKLPSTVDFRRYGYLQLRESGPVLNEQIYKIGHPAGKAKRIDATLDNGSPGTISQIYYNGTSCATGVRGIDVVKYQLDSEGGSSGSPVLAARDNAVVALHNCGGCNADGTGTNQGVDIRLVIRDLKAKGVVIKDLFADGTTTTPRPGMCAGLSSSTCQQVFFCSWNSLTAQCQRWW